jgi:hypothetical protein
MTDIYGLGSKMLSILLKIYHFLEQYVKRGLKSENVLEKKFNLQDQKKLVQLAKISINLDKFK